MVNKKTIDFSSKVLALSILFYALRGKLGAIFIIIEIFLLLYISVKYGGKPRSSACIFAAGFLFVFSFVINIFRTLSLEYYLFIGYFLTPVILMETNEEYYDTLWKWLKGISIFEAVGIYIQMLVPSLYYSFMSIILPSSNIISIKNRLMTGYYTGFTREVSFTMFLIVIGLGLYLFDAEFNKKKIIIIVFLFSALLFSGKRATLLFFILAYLITIFVKSENGIKRIKYLLIVLAGIVLIRVTYPWWGQIPALSRVNEFLKYYALNDKVGMTSGRTVIYEKAIELWENNKYFGIGWGNFKYSSSQNSWFSGFDVHNCFLQILCETGIIGLVFYSIVCLISLVNSLRAVKLYWNSSDTKSYKLAVFCYYVQLFFILYSLTEPILYEYSDYVLFFICYNCSNRLIERHKYETSRDIACTHIQSENI